MISVASVSEITITAKNWTVQIDDEKITLTHESGRVISMPVDNNGWIDFDTLWYKGTLYSGSIYVEPTEKVNFIKHDVSVTKDFSDMLLDEQRRKKENEES